jgi:hypothetical protein
MVLILRYFSSFDLVRPMVRSAQMLTALSVNMFRRDYATNFQNILFNKGKKLRRKSVRNLFSKVLHCKLLLIPPFRSRRFAIKS